MWWLTPRMRRSAGDRGATAVLVAVVVSAFGLGIGAIVLDTGSWYSVRAQLQNAADAAASAVVQTCAHGACDRSVADRYADVGHNSNSNGNFADALVDFVCGGGVASDGTISAIPGQSATPVPLCASTVGYTPTACPLPTAGSYYVDVHTKTTADVAPVMGSLLGGSGHTLRACAQASWQGVGSCTTCAAFTISLCEWYLDTNHGIGFATAPANGGPYTSSTAPYVSPPSYLDTLTERRKSAAYNVGGSNYFANINDPHTPPNDSPIAGSETVLLGHGGGASGFGGASCATGSDASNQTAPGQFGWLSTSSCAMNITGLTFTGSPGAVPPPCETLFTTSRNARTPIYLPVYSSVTGSGANTTYTMAGFAAFVVTGWGGLKQGNNFPLSHGTVVSAVTLEDTKSAFSVPISTAADYCSNYVGSSSAQCIYGYFTQALIPASAFVTGAFGPPPAGSAVIPGLNSVHLAG